MRKSIYKITGWSVLISAAMLFYVNKSIQVKPITSLVTANAQDSERTEFEIQNQDGYSQEEYTNNTNASTSDFNTPQSASNNNSQVQTTINDAPSMAINQGEDNQINAQQDFSQDALAKGGPNNNTTNNNQTYNNTTSNNISTGNMVNGSSSVSTNSSARVSAPTVVTAPPNPSGAGSTGGTGSGDPFVPIDDYYGLIFLIAVSTIVGIFTIKKTKII